jgi:hypothetical protein
MNHSCETFIWLLVGDVSILRTAPWATRAAGHFVSGDLESFR